MSAPLTPAQFAELTDLEVTCRFEALRDRLRELVPGALDHPSTFPAEPSGLLHLTINALRGCGDFATALRLVERLPSHLLGKPHRNALRAELREDLRIFGPIGTVLEQRGHVTTIANQQGREVWDRPFLIRYLLTGDRIDTKRCGFALQRMRRRMLQEWGADPGELVVELHNRKRVFEARAEQLRGKRLPKHVEGLAVYGPEAAEPDGRSTLLVYCQPGFSLLPHRVYQRLSHEYVHVALRALAGGHPIPVWLDEGLAITLTARLRRPFLDIWEERKDRALSLEFLDDVLSSASRDVSAVCLAQATVAAQALLSQGRDSLVEGLREGRTGEQWSSQPALEFMRR